MKGKVTKARWLLLPAAAALAVAMVGCGSSAKPASSAGHQLKVALITPSATNDLAFSQAMYSAVESLKTKYNLQISVQDNMYVVADAANAIQQYAAEGYNLIIANGSQYGSTVQQLAPKYPKVSFAWARPGRHSTCRTCTPTRRRLTRAATCRATWPR